MYWPYLLGFHCVLIVSFGLNRFWTCRAEYRRGVTCVYPRKLRVATCSMCIRISTKSRAGNFGGPGGSPRCAVTTVLVEPGRVMKSSRGTITLKRMYHIVDVLATPEFLHSILMFFVTMGGGVTSMKGRSCSIVTR